MIQLKSKFTKGLSAFLAILMMFTMLPESILKASADDANSNTEIADMTAGSTIQFAGKSWTLLDPSTGLVLCNSAIESGEYGTTNEFKSGNAVYDYLNNTYYNSLSSQEQAFIQNHAWTTLTAATFKIGLLTSNEANQYSSYFKAIDQDWFLGTVLGGTSNQIFRMKANQTSVSRADYISVTSTAAYRPALYLYPFMELSDDATKYCLIAVSSVNASGSGYTYANGSITLTGGYTYVLYGSTTTKRVVVPSPVTANVILNGVDIESGGTLAIASGASVNLKLIGKNTLKGSDDNAAGLSVPSGASLTITADSTGSLEADGGGGSAGIGGGKNTPCGTVTINGGTVTANGSDGGAGIGGGQLGSGGAVTINGGTVNAAGSTVNFYRLITTGEDIGTGAADGRCGSLTVGDDTTFVSLPTVNLKSNGTGAKTIFKNCVINNAASAEMTGTYGADGYIPVNVGLTATPSADNSKVSLQASVSKASEGDTYDGAGNVTFSSSSDPNGGYTAVDGGAVGVSAAAPAAAAFSPAPGKTYTIKAEYSSPNGYRKGSASTDVSIPSDDASLSGLAVTSGQLSPDFSSGTTDYTVNVGPNTGSIKVTPTANDNQATITVNGDAVTSGILSNSIALNNAGSDTTIPVVVTAQAGNTKTYTVTVHRAAEAVKTITVFSDSGSSVSVGDKLELYAWVSPSDAVQNVGWTVTTQNGGIPLQSYGDGTITENSDGTATFTGTKAGTIYVKATAKDGFGVYGLFPVHVTSNESISISSPTGGSGFKGDILPLTATVTGGGASPTVTWAIDNDAGLAQPIGMIKGAGTITDNKDGTATFNATTAGYVYVKATADGGSSQPYLIKIYAKNIAGTEKVSVSGSNSVAPGGTLQLSASVTIGDSTLNVYQNVTWGSSNDTIATVDSSGKVTGVKTGKVTITATATDGSSVSGSADITVAETGTVPTITTSSLSSGTVGTTYSQTLAAAGNALVTWSVSSGSLPDGLNLYPSTGTISGTPTKAGNFTFTVKASNTSGTDAKQLSIQIAASSPAPAKPTITIQESPVKSFLHFVTFGLFFGDTIHVSFSSADSSNIDHYEYQTVASYKTYNPNDTWIKADSFSISPDFKGSVYARAVSKDGTYSDVRVEALVVDKTKPAITAQTSLATNDPNASIPVEIKDNGAGVGTVTYQVNSDAAQSVDLTANTYSDLTKDYSFSIGSLPDGAYDVTVNAQDNAGNAAATATVHVVKNAAQIGFGFAPATLSKTYGDTPFIAAAAGGQNGGAVTYAVTSGTDVLSVDSTTGKVAIQKTGIAVITATKAAGNGYSAATAELTVDVSKATPTIQMLPTASGTQVIGQLSSSQLTGGKASVPGIFDWTNSNTVVSDSGSYDVTFTPTDTDNYKAVNCKVAVAVSPLLTGGSSNVWLDFTGVTLPSGVTSVSLGSNMLGSSSSAYTIVEKLIGNNESLGNLRGLTVYDLKLLDQNGNPIENFTGKIRAKIPIPAGMSGNLHVYWYEPANDTITDMDATQENGYLVFKTRHFSYYAIAQLKASANTGSSSGSSGGTVPNPKTGSNDWPLIPLALLGGGSMVGFAVIKRRVKYRVKKR